MAGALRLNFLLASRSSFLRILLHRRPLDPSLDGAGHGALTAGSAAVGGEHREALCVPVPSELTFNLRLPREAMLVVDCGVGDPDAQPVAFEATVTTSQSRAVQALRAARHQGSWRSLSLPFHRGPQVITLRTEKAGDGAWPQIL